MYRIRRESGEEVTLGSIDEFGAAVAAGIVTAKAEIFHARAEKWLPIASHPHFKMAHDRITAAAAPKRQLRRPRSPARGSDQRGLAASTRRAGQRDRPRVRPAPQLRVHASGPSTGCAGARAACSQLSAVKPEAGTALEQRAAPCRASRGPEAVGTAGDARQLTCAWCSPTRC